MRLWTGLTVLALLLLTAGPGRGADQPPFDIDVVLSQSGVLTFVGQTDANALSVLEATVNKQGGIRGRPIHFVYHDDHTDPQVAVQLTNEIIAKHPGIFLGSSSASSCTAMAPLVSANGPVEYCLSPAIHPPGGSYVFSSSVSSADAMRALIRYYRGRGFTRLAALSTTDLSGQDGDTNLAAALALPENTSVTLVGHEHYNTSDLSVNAQLTRLAAAKPQALVLWASGTPCATALRGLADMAWELPVAVPNANMSYAQLKQYTAFVPKELLFAGLPFLSGDAPTKQAADVQRDFFAAFSAVGVRPDFLYSTSWDPALIAVSALRALGTDAPAAKLRDYIANLHGFTGVAGAYDFRDGGQRGLTQQNLVVMRWDPDKQGWISVSRLGGAPR